jgi:predicted heme/steroid binding protein
MMAKPDEIIFTGQELKKYDGSNGVIFIAFLGRVYDISHSFHWKGRVHHAMHRAGCDLTEELKLAPHGPDMLDRFPVVDELLEPAGE